MIDTLTDIIAEIEKTLSVIAELKAMPLCNKSVELLNVVCGIADTNDDTLKKLSNEI